MIKRLIVALLAILIVSSPVYAYEVPDTSCTVKFNDSRLGAIDIYLPCNQDLFFSEKKGNLINISNQSVTGYFTYQNEDYSVSFQPYYYGRYRIDNDYQFSYLNGAYTELNGFSLVSDSDLYVSTYFTYILVGSLIFISLFVGFNFFRRRS